MNGISTTCCAGKRSGTSSYPYLDVRGVPAGGMVSKVVVQVMAAECVIECHGTGSCNPHSSVRLVSYLILIRTRRIVLEYVGLSGGGCPGRRRCSRS